MSARATLGAASILAAAVTFSACDVAANEKRGFYTNLYLGPSGLLSTDLTESRTQGGTASGSASFDPGFGFGGAVGYRYGNGWAAEVEWNYRRHPLNALRQGGTNLSSDGDFASNVLLLNGLRRFPTGGAWTPYVGAGIGWVQEIDIDITPVSGAARGYSTSGKAAFQLIGGVEYALTPQWRLTADARWMRVGTVRLDNETGNPGGSASQLKYNPLSVQVGLRYNF
jgi:opacity protein-like surface antigen